MYFPPQRKGIFQKSPNNPGRHKADKSSSPADFEIGKTALSVKMMHAHLPNGESFLKGRKIYFNIYDSLRKGRQKIYRINHLTAIELEGTIDIPKLQPKEDAHR